MKLICVKIKSTKTLCLVLILLLMLIIISEFTDAFSYRTLNGNTKNQRLDFLNQIGVFPESDSETVKNFVIPEKFSDVYENYNKLQISAGFDLKKYSGKQVLIYEYKWIKGEPEKIYYPHLIVFEGKIIGGDICDNSLNGEMLPLR